MDLLTWKADQTGGYKPDARACVADAPTLVALVRHLITPWLDGSDTLTVCAVTSTAYFPNVATTLAAAIAEELPQASAAGANSAAGARVLLVSDFVASADALSAAYTEAARVGCKIVGIAAIYLAPEVRQRWGARRSSTFWNPERRGAPSPAFAATRAPEARDASSAVATRPAATSSPRSTPLTDWTVTHWTASVASNDPIEDAAAYASSEEWRTWCVLDGHGGDGAARFAQRELLPALLARLPPRGECGAACVDAFHDVDARLMVAAARVGGAAERAGSCAVALALRPRDGVLCVAHLGDCRCLRIALALDARGRVRVLRAAALTADHTTANTAECAAVRARSGDTDAIRTSRRNSADPTLRVAGVLAVTRAFGNEPRLKNRYLTATPAVAKGSLLGRVGGSGGGGWGASAEEAGGGGDGGGDDDGDDDVVDFVALVLASDGLWDWANSAEVADWTATALEPLLAGRRVPRRTPAEQLVEAAQKRAAASANLSLGAVNRMALGAARRQVLDDITATVILARRVGGGGR